MVLFRSQTEKYRHLQEQGANTRQGGMRLGLDAVFQRPLSRCLTGIAIEGINPQIQEQFITKPALAS